MPLALNANAMIQCSHMGQFKITPTVGMTVMVGGAPALTISDPSVPMTPCPMVVPPPAGPGPTPCLMLTPGPPMTPVGFSKTVMIKGQPLLLQPAMWMTLATPPSPPVPALVSFPGQATVNVNS